MQKSFGSIFQSTYGLSYVQKSVYGHSKGSVWEGGEWWWWWWWWWVSSPPLWHHTSSKYAYRKTAPPVTLVSQVSDRPICTPHSCAFWKWAVDLHVHVSAESCRNSCKHIMLDLHSFLLHRMDHMLVIVGPINVFFFFLNKIFIQNKQKLTSVYRVYINVAGPINVAMPQNLTHPQNGQKFNTNVHTSIHKDTHVLWPPTCMYQHSYAL